MYLNESNSLRPHIHSIKDRIKDPARLKDKLLRQLLKAKEKGQAFPITEENLFVEINDLAGIRILHLHTHQIAKIDSALKEIIDEQSLELIEGPTARTWDNEYRDYFKSVGIETQESPTMYTSVHYIIKSKSKTVVTCEIQVRTLMEEVWGEVDHMINYPHPIESVACVEQIRALARATSAATRLVDSIFATFADFECQEKKVTTRRRRAKSKQPSSRKTK